MQQTVLKTDPPNAILTCVIGEELYEVGLRVLHAVLQDGSIIYTLESNTKFDGGSLVLVRLFTEAIASIVPTNSKLPLGIARI